MLTNRLNCASLMRMPRWTSDVELRQTWCTGKSGAAAASTTVAPFLGEEPPKALHRLAGRLGEPGDAPGEERRELRVEQGRHHFRVDESRDAVGAAQALGDRKSTRL